MRDLEEKLNAYVTSNKSFDFENYLNTKPLNVSMSEAASAKNILNKIGTQMKPNLSAGRIFSFKF
jgi:hypothetical protein